MTGTEEQIWIFAYGSLMWDPGFDFLEREAARLTGYHREFCVYSRRYRGTMERPGLVLGLEPGGSCRGIAYRIAPETRDAVFAYLTERELTAGTYRQKIVPVTLARGRVEAVTYLVNRGHAHYTGELPPERLAELILQGFGERGACLDYLANTVQHLDALGMKEGRFHRLLKLVQGKQGG
jgi:cation transport protein ChaC